MIFSHIHVYCSSEWFNTNGTKLSRGIYNILKLNKIPSHFKKDMHIITDEVYL